MKPCNARVLLVYHSPATFVMNDYRILSRHFQVRRFQWRGKKDLPRLAKFVLKSDIVLSWFAADHAAAAVALSRATGRKSVVIVGGVDVACVPELGYGQMTRGAHKRFLTKFALKKADAVVAVSRFIKDEVRSIAGARQVHVIYNGVDLTMFRAGEKEKLVTTIGLATRRGMVLKGVDIFLRVAESVPDAKFLVIGPHDEEIKGPDNVCFTGKIPHREVARYLSRTSVYCQLSYRESFGMGVVEAMSSGCIPVVSDRGALPEVVGDAGYIVPYGDVNAAAQAVVRALQAGEAEMVKACRRAAMFSLERREDALVELLCDLLSG